MSPRWTEMLDHVADALPAGAVCVVVDGADGQTAEVADRLAATLHAIGHPCARLTDASPHADEGAWLADRTGTRSPSPTAAAGGPTRRPAGGTW